MRLPLVDESSGAAQACHLRNVTRYHTVWSQEPGAGLVFTGIGMDHKLLDILVCPICKGRLQMSARRDALICRADRLAFPIEDGIPVMLESRALPVDSEGARSPL